MQNMKSSLASGSLHSHGAVGASKLLLVYSEHCLAINYTILEGSLGQKDPLAKCYVEFQGISA
jgi:hypothetical protein